MKKELFWFIFLLSIFSIDLVFAMPNLELNKQYIQPGETLIGKIAGNFEQTITKDNIHFFIGARELNPEFDMIFYNNIYFFYAYITKEGNYSININNILYRETDLKSINLKEDIYVKEKPITVLEQINVSGNLSTINKTEKQIFSVQPGFIFTINTAEISLANLGTQDLNISYKFEDISEKLSLSPQESKKIVLRPTNEFSYLELQSYDQTSIPIIYTPLKKNVSEEDLIKPSEYSIKLVILTNNKTTKTIQLFNFGDNNITNIKIFHNLSILTVEKEIKQMKAREVYNLTLELFSKNSGIFAENITINYSNKTLSIPLEVIFSAENNISVYQSKSCAELNGTTCYSGQSCNGTESITSDGLCCDSNCYVLTIIQDDSSSGSSGWIIGIVIFLVLGAGGFFIYKKYKSAVPIKPEEKLEKTAKLYEKRVSGSLSKE